MDEERTEDEVDHGYDDYDDFYFEEPDQQFDDMNPMYENYQGISDNEEDPTDIDHVENATKATKAYTTFHVDYREEQVSLLTSFLDIYKQPNSFPLLQFVCGPPSSGADFTIKSMLQHFQKTTGNFEYITIKKSSVIDFKGFLKTIARELHNLLSHKYKENLIKVFDAEKKQTPYPLEGQNETKKRKTYVNQQFTPNVKSGLDSRAMESFAHFRDYVHNLLLFFNSIADDREHTSIYIHLQEYDLYQQIDYHTLARMVKIFEGLSGSIFHIKIIASFTQSMLMTQYLGTNLSPVIVNFPRYTVREMQQILMKHTCKEIVKADSSFGQGFINFCVESFIDMVGININLFTVLIKRKYNDSLDRIYECNFDFIEFLKNNKQVFKDVYDVVEDDKKEEIDEMDDEFKGSKKQKLAPGMERYVDYSLVTKFVIIASYYCSYFADKNDGAYFVKDAEEANPSDLGNPGTIKTSPVKSKNEKFEPLKSPKGFEFERLLYVFNIFFYQDRNDMGFIEQNNGVRGTDVLVYNCFTTLLDVKIVGKNVNDYFDVYKPECRFKFLAPIEDAKMIAEEIGFERMELFE